MVVALEALDRADAARVRLAAEGMIAEQRAGAKMIHANPLLRIERESAAEFSRIFQAMGLHRQPPAATPIQFMGGSSSKR